MIGSILPFDAAIGDLNNDGSIDLAIADNLSGLRVMYNRNSIIPEWLMSHILNEEILDNNQQSLSDINQDDEIKLNDLILLTNGN